MVLADNVGMCWKGDSLRFEVTPVVTEIGDGFQVRVHVNDVEMTSAGAGLGMDPYDVLVPTNRLVAAVEPRTLPIARCVCGVYGCGATDVTIARDGDLVRWDWSREVPMSRGASFPAVHYDEEVARVAADHSWETAERTAGRRVLTDVDRDRLNAFGLQPRFAANHHDDDELFRVSLDLDDGYEVTVDTLWLGRDPEVLAREVCATLSHDPREWRRVSWNFARAAMNTPPAIAGPSWQRSVS
jgi:hypothetical protein